jgi:hypothetical protein
MPDQEFMLSLGVWGIAFVLVVAGVWALVDWARRKRRESAGKRGSR